MLRRLHHHQPETFVFTPANQKWAQAQMTKYPVGRQASAIIPLLWRAQEQEGWLSRPAIEAVADMLSMPYIRALEVATFYFMFQLQPVGSVAHIQVCGTLSCMISGAEDLVSVCKSRIAGHAHDLSKDGKFSWEEVECLGACSNAPMVQIGKDYYEDLTVAKFEGLLDDLAKGKVPTPGPQNGRYAAEPLSGLTSLKDFESGRTKFNASVQAATDLKDTIAKISGKEVPLTTPWLGVAAKPKVTKAPRKPAAAKP
jgi:NADH-quinone oxidoreductase subunit E